MKYARSLCILSQKDLINAGCFHISEVMEVCRDALIRYTHGDVIFPEKTSVIFDQKTQNRINCLPAGFLSKKIYGMKWVSVFPENPYRYQVPNLSAVLLLSELETGFPIALMDGTMCSNLRTAAMSALAASYLGPVHPRTIGLIGAGEQAKSHFLALKEVFPSLTNCRVASRTQASETRFVQQMEAFYPDVRFLPCGGMFQKAAEGAEIIVTAISGQEKILQASWVRPGAFYCHVGGLEDDFAVALKADKIVCDDWEVVKHRTQTISQMYQKGLLCDEDIYANLYEIVSQSKRGRESEAEFIYYNGVGLSYVDVAVAHWAYRKAVAKHIGTQFPMQDRSMFDEFLPPRK